MLHWKDYVSKLCSRVIPALIAGMLLIAGCGQGSGVTPIASSAPASPARHRLHGVIHGGQNPVAGATVTLRAAGSDGFGSAGPSLGTATTDANGHFSLDPATCPPSDMDARSKIHAASIEGDSTAETYLAATGGNAGSGANSAIALMAAIGPCDKLEDSTTVVINELTTIAAQWALQQFADSTGQNIGAPDFDPDDLGGLANAYDTIFNLADQSSSDLSVSGNASSFLPSAAQCGSGSPPVNCDGLERLDTLADIVAACVNSSGASSTACKTLFCDATPGATFSGGNCSVTPTITDTLQAAHSIAQNPTNDVSGLFALATPNAPFEPTLGSVPDGWEIALNYAPAGALLDDPKQVALDASGNVFVVNGTSVSELPAASSYSTGLNFAPSGAALNDPISIALDQSGNVFLANQTGDSVSEIFAADMGMGPYGTGASFNNLNTGSPGAQFNQPSSIALDQSGNVFVANFEGNSVSELTEGDSYGTGLNFNNSNTGSPGAVFSGPVSIALDSNGDVFVANNTGSSVSELTESDSYATGLKFAPAGALINGPIAIAVDRAANLFVANLNGNSVSELTSPSYGTSGSNFNNTSDPGAGFSFPEGIAMDGNSNAFVANFNGQSVTELTNASSYATALHFAPAGAAFSEPVSLAVDESGNVFVANFEGNSVAELIGVAKPDVTPLSAGGAGRAGAAIVVFLTLLTLWYGRKYLNRSKEMRT